MQITEITTGKRNRDAVTGGNLPVRHLINQSYLCWLISTFLFNIEDYLNDIFSLPRSPLDFILFTINTQKKYCILSVIIISRKNTLSNSTSF
jgi:hypothetical protein